MRQSSPSGENVPPDHPPDSARQCSDNLPRREEQLAVDAGGGRLFDDPQEASRLWRQIMATRVTWLGHATLLVETGGLRVLIDPFFTGNPACPMKAEQAQADFILVSHGHGDHIGDAIDIA